MQRAGLLGAASPGREVLVDLAPVTDAARPPDGRVGQLALLDLQEPLRVSHVAAPILDEPRP